MLQYLIYVYWSPGMYGLYRAALSQEITGERYPSSSAIPEYPWVLSKCSVLMWEPRFITLANSCISPFLGQTSLMTNSTLPFPPHLSQLWWCCSFPNGDMSGTRQQPEYSDWTWRWCSLRLGQKHFVSKCHVCHLILYDNSHKVRCSQIYTDN